MFSLLDPDSVVVAAGVELVTRVGRGPRVGAQLDGQIVVDIGSIQATCILVDVYRRSGCNTLGLPSRDESFNRSLNI